MIDGELVACGAEGKPDFYALIRRYTRDPSYGASIYSFSVAAISVRAFEERKIKLEALLAKANHDRLRLSLSFDDGAVLLEAAARLNLEGIVSKKRPAPYVPGTKFEGVANPTA